MHAIIFNKNKLLDQVTICNIHDISTTLWGQPLIDICILILDSKRNEIILTDDLLHSNTLNNDDIQSRIITNIYEITNT